MRVPRRASRSWRRRTQECRLPDLRRREDGLVVPPMSVSPLYQPKIDVRRPLRCERVTIASLAAGQCPRARRSCGYNSGRMSYQPHRPPSDGQPSHSPNRQPRRRKKKEPLVVVLVALVAAVVAWPFRKVFGGGGGRRGRIVLIVVLVAVALMLGVVGIDAATGRGAIHRNVRVYGVDVGGLTVNQAVQKLRHVSPKGGTLSSPGRAVRGRSPRASCARDSTRAQRRGRPTWPRAAAMWSRRAGAPLAVALTPRRAAADRLRRAARQGAARRDRAVRSTSNRSRARSASPPDSPRCGRRRTAARSTARPSFACSATS